MFTFSFSSAFAAVDYTTATFSYDQAVAELQKVAKDVTDDAQNRVTTQLAAYTGTYSKEAAKVSFEKQCADAVANTNKVLDNQLTALYEASKSAKEDAYKIDSYVNAIKATAVTKPYEENNLDFSKAEIDVLKASVKADIEKIDLSVYSKEVASGEVKSNYDKALELVTKALNVIDVQKATDDKDANDAVIMRLKWIYTPAVGLGTASGQLYSNTAAETVFGVAFVVENADGTKYYGLKDIPTTAGEAVNANKLEYAKTKALAEILGTLTADKDKYVDDYTAKIFAENQKTKPDAKKVADLEEKLADVKDAYADTVEVVTYLVNNAEKVSQLGSFDGKNLWEGTNWLQANKFGVEDFARHPIDAATKAKYLKETFRVSDAVERVKLVKEAKENAELLKASIAIDGSSAVEIDKALEKAIDEIYKGTKTDATIAGYNAYEYLYHYVEDTLIGGGAKGVKINGVKYDAIGAWDVSVYDKAKQDKVKAIIKEAKVAVRAAATVAAADDAFMAAKAKLEAVPTAAQHAKDFTLTTGAYKKAYDDAKKEVAAYAKAKVAYIAQIGVSNDYATTKDQKNLDTLIKKYQGELYSKCFNADEIAAKLAEAKAAIDGLKTDKVLADEAAAIDKEVAALPNNATLADKDAVMAAYDKVLAHNEYCDLVDSTKKVNYAKVEKLANILEDAEAKAIEDAIKAINKDGKVTLEEKAAVQDLRKAWDAYDEFWADYDKIQAQDFERSVAAIEDALSAVEITNVKNMIAKLPADGSDKAAIAAARNAFNALSRTQQHEIRHYARAYYDKLIDAEKVLGKAVTSLKIKASSKATKGAMTIKWRVIDGDKSAAAGYQVWRSTKANKGFKKMITTKKMTYKNTKNLKKGTTYYYRVRAYAEVDGKVYFSDYSNKAYRKAK